MQRQSVAGTVPNLDIYGCNAANQLIRKKVAMLCSHVIDMLCNQ